MNTQASNDSTADETFEEFVARKEQEKQEAIERRAVQESDDQDYRAWRNS
jgi:hypothetical protein